MMTGPSQAAHERLAAWARRRQREASSAVGGMSAATRERLHREVARLAEAGPGVPEPLPISAMKAGWRRWRAVAGLITVGIGALAVLAVVFRTGIDGVRRERLAAVSGERGLGVGESGAGRRVLEASGAGAPVGLDAVPLAAEGTAAAVALAAPVSASPVAPRRLVDLPGARRVPSPDGLVRLRRTYVARAEGGAVDSAGPMFRRFEVVRVRDRLEFRDQDGSVYVGRVQGGLVSQVDGGVGWGFEGRGTNLALGKVVVITGQFGPVPEADRGRADSLMEVPFAGTAVIGQTNVVELRAEPEP